MPLNNGRFALLAVLCSLAVQSLSPSGSAGVRAAVVHRQPNAGQRNHFVRHNPGMTADDDDGSLHSSQLTVSIPWLRKGDALRKGCNEKRCQKMRSVAVRNVQGAKYTMNHRRQATPLWMSEPRDSNDTAPTSSSLSGLAGTVAIMSGNPDPNDARDVAYLLLVEQANQTYVFDASVGNKTEVYLNAGSQTSSGDRFPVNLELPVNNEVYCATYDQKPSKPEPLTAQPCMRVGTASGSTSQVFMYNKTSGVIEPTYYKTQGVDAEDVGTQSSTPPSVAASASWRRRDDSYPARNVTLVFRPNREVANEAAAAEVSASTSTRSLVVFSSSASLSSSVVINATPSQSVIASGSSSAAITEVTGLSVDVVGNDPSSSVGFSSVSMAAAPSGLDQSMPSPSASSSASPSMDAAVSAASVAASYSVSSSGSATPSSSAFVGVASVSPSDDSAAASVSLSRSALPSSRAVFERNAVATPVSTDPYFWRFKAEGRF